MHSLIMTHSDTNAVNGILYREAIHVKHTSHSLHRGQGGQSIEEAGWQRAQVVV